ncbi:hypothetical protein IT399_00420 [Candidatus Nomurabacteria bacterium]|nr:hypothetical protein [Candidatus Nomurabacteria bacterium]
MGHGHPNLTPELNAILEMGSNPEQTLDMRSVQKGKCVLVSFEGKNGVHLAFEVTQKAGPDAFRNQAIGRILSSNLPTGTLDIGEGEEQIFIGGACTFNPNSRLGLTMYQGGHVTVGRWLLWGFPSQENGILLNLRVRKVLVGTPTEILASLNS